MGLRSLLRGELHFFICIWCSYQTGKAAWACTACFGESYILCTQMMFVLHRKQLYESPRPLTGIVLLTFYETGRIRLKRHGTATTSQNSVQTTPQIKHVHKEQKDIMYLTWYA
jgi:hypothetical protein